MSLATKYRPKTFDEVLGQETIIKILRRQVESEKFSHCYLFAGPSGTGKTTLGRILANEINKGVGQPIEIDAASNNGVDNVRDLIVEANERALDSKYKIFIIDECHMITTAGWNAFLKCIEEMPEYSIFIFCTTDPQKVPSTIMNRVMRFNLGLVSQDLIEAKLLNICQLEGIPRDVGSLAYISRLAQGSVRAGITYMEKCLMHSDMLTLLDVQQVLGKAKYSTMFDLTNAIYDRAQDKIIQQVEELFNDGIDLRTFLNDFISFNLDLIKYCLFQDINLTSIPIDMIESVQYTVGIGDKPGDNTRYFHNFVQKLLDIKYQLKDDVDFKTSLTISLMGV